MGVKFMNRKIFLLDEENELIEMEETDYVSEDILQELIAKHPHLLAGYEMDINDPRKWLLVEREQILPYDSTGQKLFYLDHLFLDQDGIPTIVETKRSCDNRLRREVVAQMLDYASNSLIYLPVEEIISNLIKNYPKTELDELIRTKLELEMDPEEFFQLVKTNFQAGRIRLVFVADEFPVELITIVEFLNKQMDPAEILAVEVKQYVKNGLKTLVPRLMGQTAETRLKRSFIKRNLDEKTFLEHVDKVEGTFYKKLIDFADNNQLTTKWGGKSFSINIEKNGMDINILRAYCNLSAFGQTLFATADSIKTMVPDGESILDEYFEIEDFSKKVMDGYSFTIKDMDNEETERFYEVLMTIIKRIRINC
jgi:hypothetical protein